MQKYPRCLPIIPELRHIRGASSVELELKRLQDEAKKYPDGYRQLAAIRYYLQDILWECGSIWLRETYNVSNYSVLVDKVKRFKKPGERVCFVTFNYDMLLDESLRHAGYPFTELSAYIARDLMLVKLHGSVNWARIVNTPLEDLLSFTRVDLARQLIERYTDLDISKEFVVVGEYPPAPRHKKVVFPALAIPVESKLDFECPPEHVKALEDFIPQVTKIVTIGWRATEQPFLELLQRGLKSANPQIMVVCGTTEDTENSAAQLRKRIPAQYSLLKGGFTKFMHNNPNLGS